MLTVKLIRAKEESPRCPHKNSNDGKDSNTAGDVTIDIYYIFTICIPLGLEISSNLKLLNKQELRCLSWAWLNLSAPCMRSLVHCHFLLNTTQRGVILESAFRLVKQMHSSSICRSNFKCMRVSQSSDLQYVWNAPTRFSTRSCLFSKIYQ